MSGEHKQQAALERQRQEQYLSQRWGVSHPRMRWAMGA